MNGPWGGGCSLSLNQADKVVTPRAPIHPHISSALNVCFSSEYSDEPRRRLFCPSKIMLGRLQDNVRFGEQKELATWHKNECLREDIDGKKTFSFGHCPNVGGGGSTHARIFWPFFPPCFPLYFDINIMLFDTFWSFLTPKSSKVPKL